MQSVYKKRTHDTHMNKHLPYIRNEKNPIDIILLGDSHFERLVWFDKDVNRSLPRNMFVASVGGDRVENILYRLESDDGLIAALKSRPPSTYSNRPKKIVLMAGGNNLFASNGKVDSPQTTVDKMKYLIQYLNKELPGVILEVWAIPRHSDNSSLVAEYNRLLGEMCKNELCLFSNKVYNNTLKYGYGIFHTDNAHLSKFGYMKCVVPEIRNL